MTDMDCEQRKQKLYLYVDGELRAGESASLEAHLRACPACGLAEKQIRQLRGLLRTDPAEIEPSVQFESRFWQKVQERRTSGRVIEWLESVARVFLNPKASQVAAALMVAVLI